MTRLRFWRGILLLGATALACYLLFEWTGASESALVVAAPTAPTSSNLPEMHAVSGVATLPEAQINIPFVKQASKDAVTDFWRADANALLAYFRRGLESKKPEDNYVAMEILNFCKPILLEYQHVEVLQSNILQLYKAFSARQKLRERCGALYAYSPSALRQAERDLIAALQNAPNPVNPHDAELSRQDFIDGSAEKVRANLRAALFNYGEEALIWIGPGLATWLEYSGQDKTLRPGMEPIFLESGDLQHAILLAMCAAEFDCSTDSLLMLKMCAEQGQCGESLDSAVLSAIPDSARRDLVARQARAISSAIRSKALYRLGL
ncbi:hypothetical protein RQP53_21115 [Paucibacter sp. APW11]|uniref:Imelysin-like domain-containing protein n=1 Tax=Roseateles aquae TaxID=3077235 RepID=A0ABU3PGS4_9BURK|nr:hypothetical protein [Paucibacter sp. APW11]MDT9001791.1 hypothetical protein [Paucibacter sp. APW11]